MPAKSQSSGYKSLTKAQQETLEFLMSGNTDIKQADTTRLINSLSKMDKLTPEILDAVVNIERRKNPTLTETQIKAKFLSRYKGAVKELLKNDIKITEETKEEKQTRRLEKKKGTMDEFKEKTNIAETPIRPLNPFIPNPNQTPPNLNRTYQNPFIPNPNQPPLQFQGIANQPAIYSSMFPSAPPDNSFPSFPDARSPALIEQPDVYYNRDNDPFNDATPPWYEDALNMANPPPSLYERASNAASNLYRGGVNLYGQASDLYFENKPMIDGLEKTFSKKNIDNGSWFTELASLEAPQIAIIQQILKFTPIGATQIDYEVINAIASGNGDNVPDSQRIKTMLKTIVNPDLMGKVIGTTIKQSYDSSVEAISKTFDKAMGTKAVIDKTSLEQQSADAIKKRLEEMKTQENRKKYIDSIMGRTTPPTPPNTPTTNKNAAEILAPPDISNFGYHETTVMEDLGRFFRNAIGLGQFSGPSNKEEYIQYLKVNNPTLYNKYQQTVKDYNWNLKKSTLTQDSDLDVNLEQNKKVIQSIISTNDVLTKRAKDLGLSDPKLIGEAYDINEKLKKVMAGTGGVMSYAEVKKLQEEIINLYPQSVLNAASKDLNQLYGDVDNIFSSKFTGDSNISTRPDIPTNDDRLIDPNRIKTIKPIAETQISSKDYSGSSFPRLRPRLVWGNEEDILTRDADEVNNANIYADMMSMEMPGWSNGISNPLFLINQQTENRRYAQTFPMPKFKPKRISRPTQAYSQLSKIIFTPQYSQPEYSPFDTARNQYDFGQFQNFAPSVFNSVFPVKLQQDFPQYFPYVINEETGGEGLQVNTNASANIPNNKLSSYLTNQRFTRR